MKLQEQYRQSAVIAQDQAAKARTLQERQFWKWAAESWQVLAANEPRADVQLERFENEAAKRGTGQHVSTAPQ